MYFLEDVLKRYVIATLDVPTKYLVFKDNSISFTSKISRCTKTVSKNTAKSIRDEFYAYTKRIDIELAIVPVQITYELVRGSVTDGDNYVS